MPSIDTTFYCLTQRTHKWRFISMQDVHIHALYAKLSCHLWTMWLPRGDSNEPGSVVSYALN